MRPKMSALTTTILGAVVTASTVSAQQLPPTNPAPRNRSAAADPATAPTPASEPESATDAESDPMFGMIAMRGARYLLRNGLDYLNYQQYERALKFLREAEVRQKDLNKAEKLKLKQGIERAQRGLREAADAESPYALSDRSRRRNGFMAAKPETQIAANPDNGPSSPTHKANRLDQPTRLGNDSEDQGEPIRLASADLVSGAPAPQAGTSPSSTKTRAAVSDHREDDPLAASQPEIPVLPATPQLTEVPDVNASGTLPSPKAGTTSPAQSPQPQSQQPVAGAATNGGEVLTSLPPLDPATEPAAPTQGPAKGNSVGKPEAVVTAPVQPLPKAAAGNGTDSSAVQASPKPVPAAEPVLVAQAAVEPPGIQLTDNRATDQVTASQPPALTGDAPVLTAPATISSLAPAEAPPLRASAEATPTPANAAASSVSVEATPASVPTPQDATAVSAPAELTPSAMPADVKTTRSPSPTSVETKIPPTVSTPPKSSEVIQTTGSNPEPEPTSTSTSTKPAVIDLDRIALPPLSNSSGQPDNSGNSAHKETEDVTPVTTPSPVKAAASASAPALAQATDVVLSPASAADNNDLPPLPPELGSSDAPRSTTVAAPVPTGASRAVATISPAGSPPAASGAAHTEDEKPATVPVVNDPGPATTTASASPGAQPAPANPVSSEPVPTPTPIAAPTDLDLPPLPNVGAASPAPAQAAEPAPAQAPATSPTPAQAPATQPFPTSNPNLEREPEAVSLETGVERGRTSASAPPDRSSRKLDGTGFDPFLPKRAAPPSTLRPELLREVEEIARRQEDELRRNMQVPPQPGTAPRDAAATDLRAQTQLDISRAPSPAEARPIKAIPVPEDWVPLAQRDWTPQRKYWAAAATCHLPLYFQDPVLERYGHSVEQFVGPVGRYLTYPVDDPTQSTQRNQIVQPFFSAGLFALQVATWPYNLIMDPPWEAQYDLGYYRPGDPIPTDTYWLPLHGYGPPLHGSKY